VTGAPTRRVHRNFLDDLAYVYQSPIPLASTSDEKSNIHATLFCHQTVLSTFYRRDTLELNSLISMKLKMDNQTSADVIRHSPAHSCNRCKDTLFQICAGTNPVKSRIEFKLHMYEAKVVRNRTLSLEEKSQAIWLRVLWVCIWVLDFGLGLGNVLIGSVGTIFIVKVAILS
jgi:hypothetical protein